MSALGKLLGKKTYPWVDNFPSDPGEVIQRFHLLRQGQLTQRIHVNVSHAQYPLAIEN